MKVKMLVTAGLALASLVTLPAIATAGLAWHSNVGTQESQELGFGPGDVMSTSRALGNGDNPDIFGGSESPNCGSPRDNAGEPQPVPEPATLLLVGIGSLAAAATRRRSK